LMSFFVSKKTSGFLKKSEVLFYLLGNYYF